MYKKFIDRVKYQGFFSAVNYFLFTVGAEKLGIEIIEQFLYRGSIVDKFEDHNIKIYGEKSDIPILLLNELTLGCGARFSKSVEGKLNRGEKLAIGVVDGHAASIAWLKKLEQNSLHKEESFWLIHGCLTMPEYRGLGLYPRSIRQLTELAFNLTGLNLKTNVLIESSIANKASSKGITQCGFKNFGYVINYKDKTLFRSKGENSWILPK